MARAGAPAEQHYQWMLENWDKYRDVIAKFDDGLVVGRIDYKALIEAHELAVLTWINAVDANAYPEERKARAIVDEIAELLRRLTVAGRVSCKACGAWWNRYKGDCMGDITSTDLDGVPLAARP